VAAYFFVLLGFYILAFGLVKYVYYIELGFQCLGLMVMSLLWCHSQGLLVLFSVFSCCQCNGELRLLAVLGHSVRGDKFLLEVGCKDVSELLG
jgi:hypothetical protein